jgi:YihY family inner membrane protein
VNPVERVVRAVDRAQQRNPAAGFVVSIVKKFGDDRGSTLAALLAYYGFLSLFPALLVLTTVVGFVGNDRLADSVLGSVLGELPVFGEHIGEDATRPLEGNPVALAVGLLGVTYGALGVAQAGQHAMAQIWNVPGVVRPGFVPRLLRSVGFLVLLAAGILLIATVGAEGTLGDTSAATRAAALLLQLLLTALLYVAAFRVLTPRTIPVLDLVPGAVGAAVAYSALLLLGTNLVRNQLSRAEDLYGQFALVLGLLGWLFLVAEISLYAAEVNVVWRRRLWPRSIVQPPLTPADLRVLEAIARQEERRPEQVVLVDFEEPT